MLRGRQTIALKKISAVSIVAFAVIGMALTYTTAGLISMQQVMPKTNRKLPSSGNISALNVDIYSDYACTQKLDSLDWGDITPGDPVSKTIYLKNTGNTRIKLGMTKSNWNPPQANGLITLTWDKENEVLNPKQTATATLTIRAADEIVDITTFSVTILICGSA
jgi:hypothetical protein